MLKRTALHSARIISSEWLGLDYAFFSSFGLQQEELGQSVHLQPPNNLKASKPLISTAAPTSSHLPLSSIVMASSLCKKDANNCLEALSECSCS